MDKGLARFHAAAFARHPLASLLVATAIYAGVVLAFGTGLAISSNYFILLPLLAAATAYRLPGGLVAGFLALPSNLLLFGIIGHPEFSPASKLIAWLSGIFVGTVLGYLADYFSKLAEEVERRAGVEDSLRRAIADKDFLLREVHHRVRNNLTVIKSIIQLQKSRSSDPALREAMDDLLARVFAIAQAHEQLLAPEELPAIDLRSYIASLVGSITKGAPVGLAGSPRLTESYPAEPVIVAPEFAAPIGLFLNEALQNALHHAWDAKDSPALTVSLAGEGGGFDLTVEDNGRGLREPPTERLGFRMMRALAAQVDGEASFGPAPLSSEGGIEPSRHAGPGTRVLLRFRLPPYSASMKG